MKTLESMAVTEVQFFNHTHQIQVGENEFEDVVEYSANVIFDNCFVVQLSGNEEEAHMPSIPSAVECYYNNEELQDHGCENFDIDSVIKALEDNGIVNNFHFLNKFADVL